MNAVIVVSQERPEPQQTFWEKHKKKIKWGLAIAGGTLVGILAYKNRDTIASWLGQLFGQSAKETVASPVAIQQTDIVETITTQHIDVPMYTREKEEIEQKITAYEHNIERVAQLKELISKEKLLEEFNREIFRTMVEKVIIDGNEATFHFNGELKITEIIEKK